MEGLRVGQDVLLLGGVMMDYYFVLKEFPERAGMR